jgi:hypothetical protein
MTNENASPESVANELDGIDGNGGTLPWRQVAMFFEANMFGLSKDYAFPEGPNATPSMPNHATSLAKLLTRKHTMSDGNSYDALDCLWTITKSVLAANPHINDDEPLSVNYKKPA